MPSTKPLLENSLGDLIYAVHDDTDQKVISLLTNAGQRKEITRIPGDLLTGVKGRVSPDGAKLLLTTYYVLSPYQSQRPRSPLLLVNLETMETNMILTPKKEEWINSFIWSSDSEALFYVLETFSEPRGIWRYDLATKESHMLASGREFDDRGFISFLGQVVQENIFLSLESEFILSFWEMDPNGSELKRLFTPPPASTVLPALSPDERMIAYYVYGPESSFANTLQTLDIVTQERRDVLELDKPEAFLPYAPLWSPDGQEILYGYLGGLWVTDSDSGQSQELATVHGSPNEPLAWSPTGELIAVAVYQQKGLLRGRDLYNIALIDYKQKTIYTIVEDDVQFIDWLPRKQ